MSFLSDLIHGNFGNLGHDLAPSNIFSDFGTDLKKGLSNPLLDAALIAGIAAPFALPELAGLFGTGAAAAGAGDIAGSLGAASLGAAEDAALPATAELTSGIVPADLISQDFATLGPGADTSVVTGAAPGVSSSAVPALGIDAGNAASTGIAAPGALSNITSMLSPVTSAFKAASPLIGATGLAANLYSGYQQKKQLDALNASEAQKAQTAQNIANADQAAAGPMLSSGQTLMTYLQTGTLPADFETQVKTQLDAAKAGVIQGYAARGQNTNPEQNSALQQDLAAVDQRGAELRTNIENTLNTAGQQMVQTANKLLDSGLTATQLSAELPIQVAQLNTQLNKAMSDAIGNFAAALNGSGTGNRGITLTLPQNLISPQGTANV